MAQRHILVIANQTVAGHALIDAVRSKAGDGDGLVTVLAPINQPQRGYVVYEDTRRASAGRRLERALAELREAGIRASGMVVDCDPASAARDAIAQIAQPVPFSAAMEAFEEERIDEILVSTFEQGRSGWLRRDLLERLRDATKLPVEHVVVEAAQVEEVTA